ncbi:hypothetical protein C5167_030212, partial [Papaver somniferum]
MVVFLEEIVTMFAKITRKYVKNPIRSFRFGRVENGLISNWNYRLDENSFSRKMVCVLKLGRMVWHNNTTTTGCKASSSHFPGISKYK